MYGDWLVLVTEDFDIEARARFGGASCLIGKSEQIFIITRDDPSTLSLPVVIIDEYFQFISDPLIGRYITSFSSHRDSFQGRNIIFIDPFPSIIFFSDSSQSSRTGIQSINFIFLDDSP